MIKAFTLGITLFLSINLVSAGATDFPYRKDYPNVPTVSSEDLLKKYEADKVIIVDVRSTIEFNVIHPVNAVHIPIANKAFVKKVGKLIAQHPGKEIAFYCNGISCLKSYKAAQKAVAKGYKNCFAYDAGIPEWVSLFPEKTLLLGSIVVDPDKQIIPKSLFKKKCIDFNAFKEKAASSATIVIDARDPIQRVRDLPGLTKPLLMPFDKLIPNFIAKKRQQDKALLIFDQVGKQVRWLEYYLVKNGYTDYYFLKGGATAVLKDQTYR